MATAAEVSRDDTVLEIGPGTGLLTRVLLGRAKRVIAVEADDELIPRLQETFAAEIASGALTLIHEDVRKFDPNSIKCPYLLVANIPYYITGELFRQFLTAEHKPASMTYLIQKEVAERIARPKNGKEGLLSLSVRAYGSPKYRFTVPRGAFVPAPNVDSAVLSVENIRSDAFGSKTEEEWFFTILRAGFAHKRKTLKGNLSELATPSQLLEAFATAGIDEKARAEDLKLPTWMALTRALPHTEPN